MGNPFQSELPNRRAFLIAVAAGLTGLPCLSFAQSIESSPNRQKIRRGNEPSLAPELQSNLVVIPGNVTDQSATLNLLSSVKSELTIQYGTHLDRLIQSQKIKLQSNEPTEVILGKLKSDTEYYYQIAGQQTGQSKSALAYRFHTQRANGKTYTFTIQGDSHPERPQMFDSRLYTKTLQSIASDRPDFHICMGDDFSITHLNAFSAESIASRYILQRSFLGLVGKAAPVFLLNGNHEQASLFNYNQTGEAHDIAVWAQNARNKYFSLPQADGFYSGNTSKLKEIGNLRDYYAWNWGDALFVVLDNYWHSPASVDTKLNEEDNKREGKDRDWWGITLGDEQYEWFKKTLESSRVKYKFVFAHHVMGTSRGGIERARLFEWGDSGHDFKKNRPNWEMPIHDLMKKHGVNIFFQGHDHLYAKQELDGIIYQTVPVPADANYTTYNENRYLSGTKLPNSGYLRVNVGPKNATVEYVRSFLKDDPSKNQTHGEIAHRYTI